MTEAAESTPAVADLLARARVYVEGSHAKQTLEAYAADWKHFSTWCEEHKRRSLPAGPRRWRFAPTRSVIGFAGAFRRSELVALTMEDIQTTHEGLMRLRIGAQRHRHLAALEDR
jgi:site-specific recombinase XerD